MSEVVAATEPEPATAPVDEPAASDPDRPEPVIRTRRLTKKYGELTAKRKRKPLKKKG